jgi:hypothetical protein
MPLVLARAIPAFVRSLIFCAATFARDQGRQQDQQDIADQLIVRC